MLKKFLTLALVTSIATGLAPLCLAEDTPAATPPPASAPTGSPEKPAPETELEKARNLFKSQISTAEDESQLPPALFYNYGTTMAKAGALGEAYVALLRTAFALPFDGDARHNLSLVEGQLPTSIRAIRPTTWFDWWPNNLRTLPWQLWLILGMAASAFLLALAHKAEGPLLLLLAMTAVAFLGVAALAWWQVHLPIYGVTTSAKVKSGPANTYSDMLTVEAGSLVGSEASREGWLKIRFVKGGADQETVGWIETSNVLRIR